MKSARLPLVSLVAALVAALLFGLFGRSAHAEEEIWQTDFKAALAKAKAEKKYVLVDFTGSDWCVWCKKLHSEVFDKEPFKAAAPKQFVLVELDFPQAKEQPDELKKQNSELAQKYKIQGYPSVLVLDAEGQVIARTGYREGGPEEYLKELAGFGKIYEEVVALKAKLDSVKGLDRAKVLDQIVEGYSKLGNESDEVEAWSKEIIALDADNKLGLKVKYEFPEKIGEAEKLAQSGKTGEALEAIDKALAAAGLPPEMRQEGLMTKGSICMQAHKFGDSRAAFKAAKDAAPQSSSAKRIGSIIEQISKMVEAEEAVAKLEAEADKSQGVERAKLLDKLITAAQKLPPDEEAMNKMQKWMKEVVALDADGKAGLKGKYQFKAALTEVAKLAQSGKIDEAQAAIDKALETPGVGGEELQQGLFLKAQLSLSHQDVKTGVDSLKKALDAAPDSKLAPMLKQMIGQLDKSKNVKVKDPEQYDRVRWRRFTGTAARANLNA